MIWLIVIYYYHNSFLGLNSLNTCFAALVELQQNLLYFPIVGKLLF